MGNTGKLGYRPALDGLRAFAVTVVVVDHAAMIAGVTPPVAHLALGQVGVAIFFVLSGFLITVLMCEEQDRTGRLSLRGFYRRRAGRLFVPLGLFLLAMWAAAEAQGLDIRKELLLVAGYVGNWQRALGHNLSGGLGHTWSLAIEEQFYLLWPALFLLAGGAVRWARTAWVAAAITAASTVSLWLHTDDGWWAYNATDTRVGTIMAGCLVGILWHRGHIRSGSAWRPAGWAATAAALWAPVPLWVRLTLMAVAGVGLVLGYVDGHPMFGHPAAVWVGRRSYVIYLWHWALLLALPVWAAIPAMLGWAALSWRYIEQPLIAWSRARVDNRERPVRDRGRVEVPVGLHGHPDRVVGAVAGNVDRDP